MEILSDASRDSPLYLGIEIGGTKLQLGVGRAGDSQLETLRSLNVDRQRGATGILQQITACGWELKNRYPLKAVGIGFGGPVDCQNGRVIRSHQIDGWSDFPLANWCRHTLDLPTFLDNDCDVAGLAEATIGAGRGSHVVFYITVGSGVGGGLIIRRQIHHGAGRATAEIGHLRPGLNAHNPEETIESAASGWSIEAAVRSRLNEILADRGEVFSSNHGSSAGVLVETRTSILQRNCQQLALDLLSRADGRIEQVTTKIIGQAAAEGNRLATEVLKQACDALGWAIAQVVTIVAPDVVILGGGVPQIGEELFMEPVRRAAAGYVFPPLLGSYQVLPAQLGGEVVVHGAIALAAVE